MTGAAADAHGAFARKAWLRALELTAQHAGTPRRTLGVVIDEGARRYGDAPALLSESQCLTHRELATRSHRYARWALCEGLVKGDVVCLVMENCPEYLAAWLGLTRAGVVVALVNPQLRDKALIHAVDLVAPRHVIVGQRLECELAPSLVQLARPARLWTLGNAASEAALDGMLALMDDSELAADECPFPEIGDAALYIYTSGTTGLPKAARVSHFRVMQWSHWFAGLIGTDATDRMYNCLPMYHSVGGIVAIGAPLVAGASVVVRERFSASQFWDDIARWDCTLFQYIGELCRILVNQPVHARETGHRIRVACGNGLGKDIWERFSERFRIGRIIEFYAATEANFSLYNCEGKPGALGRVPPFLAHRFPLALVQFDVGRGLPVRDESGHCLRAAVDQAGEAISRISQDGANPGSRFEGYSDPVASDGKVLRDVFEKGDSWFRSGDLMRRDGAGFYYFVDRIGDTFRWKGENVSTTEVAATLCGCPGVTEALVYGVAVPGHDGRAGMAALLTRPEFRLDLLWQHAERTLPRYARPQFLRLIGGIDMTGTFKPMKSELARTAFDPALTADALYASDSGAGNYVALDDSLYRRICAGQWRL